MDACDTVTQRYPGARGAGRGKAEGGWGRGGVDGEAREAQVSRAGSQAEKAFVC